MSRGPEDETSVRQKPVIHSVEDLTTATEGRYTAGGRFVIRGSGFGDFEEVPLDVGVYLNNERKSGLRRVEHYISWRDDEFQGQWLWRLFGHQRVFVETRAGCGLIHSAIHGLPLEPALPQPDQP